MIADGGRDKHISLARRYEISETVTVAISRRPSRKIVSSAELPMPMRSSSAASSAMVCTGLPSTWVMTSPSVLDARSMPRSPASAALPCGKTSMMTTPSTPTRAATCSGAARMRMPGRAAFHPDHSTKIISTNWLERVIGEINPRTEGGGLRAPTAPPATYLLSPQRRQHRPHGRGADVPTEPRVDGQPVLRELGNPRILRPQSPLHASRRARLTGQAARTRDKSHRHHALWHDLRSPTPGAGFSREVQRRCGVNGGAAERGRRHR